MKPAAPGAYRPQGGHTTPLETRRATPRTDADGAPMRPFPARSLLGAGLPARLALVAGALALLWLTVSWALR
jgi:hypothetical protein